MPSRKRPIRSAIAKVRPSCIKKLWAPAKQHSSYPSVRTNLANPPIYHRVARSIRLISRFEPSLRGVRAPQINFILNMIGPIPYVGGKNRIARKIIEIFPEHMTYVEPFAGGAQVFFHKKPSPVEILNDLDGEIVNFYRVCQSHHEELVRTLKFTIPSRALFDWYKAQNPVGLTDIQRAARFFYLQKNAFGGQVARQNFHYCIAQPANLNAQALPQLIGNVHERLAKVQIERLPYEQILKRYDRPRTLFYLDPPYWNRRLYHFNFTTSDFVRLEERLRNIRGKFVLSLNDLPEVRQLFKRYFIRGIEFAYSSQMKAGRKYPEVLIANFAMKKQHTESAKPQALEASVKS